MPDYIPNNDAEFNTWQLNFVSALQASPTELGIAEAELTTLLTVQSNWETAYENHTQAQAAAQSAYQDKEEARQACEGLIRNLVRRLQASDTITNAQRGSLGITIPSSSRTTTARPTSRPIATITEMKPLMHTLRFADEETPTRRAKPTGVMGAEIWVKIGEAPTGTDDLTFLGLDTRTPYVSEFDDSNVGQTAYYRLRWVNTRGEQGPWSDLVSAPIMG